MQQPLLLLVLSLLSSSDLSDVKMKRSISISLFFNMKGGNRDPKFNKLGKLHEAEAVESEAKQIRAFHSSSQVSSGIAGGATVQ
jgi:hypothetical protein